ncbi:RNA-guided endonuclease InsQ/TnpB family protein [Anthocerotibacter panamensis]|uniref:RNA-guided endonuclease InsQ/TnpB family protein n=1 Tax=Anthocerotibacter panamensis TaxID=2857077 RepID=UPI001C407E26|nr:RNA-guided endonuclease TnpB family protein [Anthocerotibacter panamensis]
MITAYKYKLRPTQAQAAQIDEWLELLRMQYNYRLAERFNWYEATRCPINACSIVSCSIAPIVEQPDYYWQKRDLLNTKKLFPKYTGIHSQVLQNCIERVKKAFDRYFKVDVSGKRSGKPRFKGRGRYRSFTYPQIKQACIQNNRITLPKIGEVKIIVHRPIPDGFKIKTAQVIKAADGYYVTLTLEDKSVPILKLDLNTEKTVGIDMGLKDFLITSDSKTVPIPQFARKAERDKKKLNKVVSRRKNKASKRRRKAITRLAKHYQKVSRQRQNFHYNTAKELICDYDIIAYEDLNVKGLAKTRMSKSILDAGWSEFLSIVERKAENAGRLTIAVNPYGTSQVCSNVDCGASVPKTLADRWHSCPHCGLELDRDVNAAINIKNIAVGRTGIKAQVMPYAIAGFTEKPALYP